MTALSPTMFQLDSPPVEAAKDPLFNERFDAFLQKSLADIKAFAERELRPYDEVTQDLHQEYLVF